MASSTPASSIPEHGIVRCAPTEDRKERFEVLEPFAKGHLDVGDGHEIYYEVSGNKDSEHAAVYLHGGPGAGCGPSAAGLFDPSFYKIVVFDQRGSGRSKPNGEIARANTTWHLVADIERLRAEVAGVDKWAVVEGGSWGSTLALAYAQKHPGRVSSLVLRGVFLFDAESIAWLFQKGGVSEVYPDAFERYASAIAPGERGDLLGAYHRRVMSDDMAVAIPAAREFVRWELSVSTLRGLEADQLDEILADDAFALPFARAETHFFVFGGWFPDEAAEAAGEDPGKPDDADESGPPAAGPAAGGPCGHGASSLPYLLRHMDRVADIPTWIVHGRCDVVCRPRAAFEVYKRLRRCRLEYVHDAGHSEGEAGTTARLVAATEDAKRLFA